MSSYDKISTIILNVMFGAVLASMAILLSSSTSADSTSANATVTVGSACTMTATVGTAHTAEVPAGSTKTDIGSTTLNTICNDAGGYAIYAVGYSGDEYGNNKMINGTNEINTGTGSSASNWNMSLSQVTTGTYATTIDGGFGSYSSIPATYTKVAHRDSMTDSTTGSSINLTYGAYVASTQAPGDYVGKVKFTMVHPATEIPLAPQTTEAGCIRYYPNGSNVEGTMGCQSISTSATSATLLASNFSREGYGFAGWSKTYDYSDTTGFLGPQEYITFTAGQYTGNNSGLSLYARWIKSAGNLQGWTGCASMTSGDVTALTDQRDGETYAVAKLADGKCWMIENLRLEADNSSDETLAQGFGKSTTYGNFVGLADAENTGFTSSTYSANSLYSDDGSNDTINIGTGGFLVYRMPRYNNYNTPTSATDRPQNPTTNDATNSTSNAGMYSYGNYYTWSAAMANTIYYNSPTVTDADGKTSETVGTSLCPAGWRLPRGGDKSREATNDLWALVVTSINNGINPANYDSSTTPYYTDTAEAGPVANALVAYPNNFLYSGYFSTASASNRGFGGLYWSSTATNSDRSYNLYLNGSYGSKVYPGTDYSNKYNGLSIRCTVGS